MDACSQMDQSVFQEPGRKRRHHVLAVTALVLGGAALWMLWPRQSLASKARSLSDALFHGDAEYIASCLSDFELVQAGLTRGQAKEIVDQVILPAYSGKKIIGEETAVVNQGTTALHNVYLRMSDGSRFQANVRYDYGTEGDVVLLAYLLNMSWLIQYEERNPLDTDLKGLRAVNWGFKRDRAKLEALGMKNWPSGEFDKPSRSLHDNWLARLETARKLGLDIE